MTITVNGAPINVTDRGSGHAVLFLHGMGCDGSDWNPQLDRFADQYRCIAVDHRGHGRSTREVGEGFSIPGFAADALAVLDHLDVEAAHVVGLSMGGMIAQQIALTAPERVCTLSLLDTFCRPGPLGEGLAAMADQIESDGVETILGAFQATVFAAATRADKTDIIERFEVQFRENTPACLASDLRAIGSFDTFPLLEQIAAPTVVLCGAEDLLTPVDQAAEIAAAIPKARLEVVPDAGHFSNIENPQVVDAALAAQFAIACAH